MQKNIFIIDEEDETEQLSGPYCFIEAAFSLYNCIKDHKIML